MFDGAAGKQRQTPIQFWKRLQKMAPPTESPDLRQRIIERVIEMKNGNDKCTPQPECARAALAHYNTLLPDLRLNDGVRDALKAVK